MSEHFLVIRAQVPDAERDAFDRWYGTDHLPEAIQNLKAERAWRFWSLTQPGVHYAVYGFADPSLPLTIKARADREGGANVAWPNVEFSREVVTLSGSAHAQQRH